jgi:HAD superfamily hydrolase (TIGR01490 family)
LALAIFDLDNTLLGGDSDHAWGQFACAAGIVDDAGFSARNDAFYEDYQQGRLDIDAYVRHALSPIAGRTPGEVKAWQTRFMAEWIEPMLLPQASELLARHRAAGDHLLIITATSEFITRPIADRLGVGDLLACQGVQVDGVYTGEPQGILTYGAGKVERLEEWLSGRPLTMSGSFFYSDSHNDLPLLERVDNPVAVDPDDTLRAEAVRRGWPVMSLRD